MTVVAHKDAQPATVFDAENLGFLAGRAGAAEMPQGMDRFKQEAWRRGWMAGNALNPWRALRLYLQKTA